MKDINLQRKVIVGALAVLLLADLGFAFFNSRLSAAREIPAEQTLAAQNRQVATMRDDIKRATMIRKGVPKVTQGFDQFESTLPASSNGYSVISQEIDDIAKDTHVAIEGTRFREKDLAGRNLSEIDFESTISGDYPGIVRFLNKLQRSKNAYIVDSLQLDSTTGTQTANGPLKVGLHLRTYFRKA
jgi:Type II secretion system (T2SS), protein M subtype b